MVNIIHKGKSVVARGFTHRHKAERSLEIITRSMVEAQNGWVITDSKVVRDWVRGTHSLVIKCQVETGAMIISTLLRSI